MTELKLEVGKTYVDSRGNKALIVANPAYPTNAFFPFYSNGNTYMDNGKFYRYDTHSSDLISEYIEPAACTARDALMESISRLSKSARTPHKWAKEMHAFADGYEIEYYRHDRFVPDQWTSIEVPNWCIQCEYRIKPESAPLKPNEVSFVSVSSTGIGNVVWDSPDLRILKNQFFNKALRIEFNPNDQTLVSAEVVTL